MTKPAHLTVRVSRDTEERIDRERDRLRATGMDASRADVIRMALLAHLPPRTRESPQEREEASR